MRNEIIETGKTVDAAIDSACEKLGCSRDDCEWEIIDLPKKGFLGIKNIPAKVRVGVNTPDEKPAKREFQPEPKRQEQKLEKPKVKQERPPQPARQEAAGNERQAPRQRNEAVAQPEYKRPQPLKTDELTEKETLARDYIAAIMGEMGLGAEYAVTHEHGGTCINITGKSLGAVIGRRGETLDAIQYLTGLAANRGDGEYLRLTVDCGDYRLKRKDTLEALAKKLASQVLKTNVSKTLEPMNPFERRIIHATVSEIEGVSSSSIGEEPNRRVIITSPTARPASRSGFRSGGDRGGHAGRGPRRDFRPAGSDAGNQEKKPDADERSYHGRSDRFDKGSRDKDRGSRGPKPASPAPQGPPKQTLESEVTQGVQFGKIDL